MDRRTEDKKNDWNTNKQKHRQRERKKYLNFENLTKNSKLTKSYRKREEGKKKNNKHRKTEDRKND